MNFGMIFKVAIRAILRNKTRSVLTCIGIIVGIFAIFAYNFLVIRVDRVQNDLENGIISFMEIVHEKKENI